MVFGFVRGVLEEFLDVGFVYIFCFVGYCRLWNFWGFFGLVEFNVLLCGVV